MNQIEKFCDRELQEMQEYCKEIAKLSVIPRVAKDINTIALVEINRELDERKIRKEINKCVKEK